MRAIFLKIFNSNNRAAIERTAKIALDLALDDEKDALQRILDARQLDDIHAIAAEAMGNHAAAAAIRADQARQAARQGEASFELLAEDVPA